MKELIRKIVSRLRPRRQRHGSWNGRTVVLVVGLLVAVFGLAKLIGYGAGMLSSRRATQELRDVYRTEQTAAPDTDTDAPAQTPKAEPTATAEPTPKPSPEPTATPSVTQSPIPRLPSASYPDNLKLAVSSRFKSLRKESRDIVGWLTVGRMLDDVVVQRDNVFYLDHDVSGNKNVNGALFLDAGIDLKSRPYAYIIYGHNMKSGAMFGFLRSYENISYYHNNPFITFETMYETGRYVIFATGKVSLEEKSKDYLDYYALRADILADRVTAINALISTSMHTCRIDVRADDQLLLLSTCVGNPDERRVVAARRIRPGEDETELKRLVGESRKR